HPGSSGSPGPPAPVAPPARGAAALLHLSGVESKNPQPSGAVEHTGATEAQRRRATTSTVLTSEELNMLLGDDR
ncbi:MAG TPA: hypothetical protein DEB06_00150, partial [Phycisphaerales bacterium]|nr:hypothetical protein [Phycisphaerales bacterium]